MCVNNVELYEMETRITHEGGTGSSFQRTRDRADGDRYNLRAVYTEDREHHLTTCYGCNN